jgi:hypothetical protein
MKRFSAMQLAIAALVIAVVGAFAAYRYICFSTGEGIKAFVHLGVDAIEAAARPLADIEYALHYDATERTFSVKPRDSSVERASIKDSDLYDFIWQLSPRPLKLAVIYKASDFPTSTSTADFEQRTLKAIEPTGVKVMFLKSAPTQSLTE